MQILEDLQKLVAVNEQTSRTIEYKYPSYPLLNQIILKIIKIHYDHIQYQYTNKTNKLSIQMRKIFSSASLTKLSLMDCRIYFSFCSTQSKIQIENYDLITIGPYANGVAKMVNFRSKVPVSMLTVQTENYVVQPSLMMNCIKDMEYEQKQKQKQDKMHVKLNQNNQKFSTIQKGVSVKKIQPQKSQITLNNGKTYGYNYLVLQSLPEQPSTPTPTQQPPSQNSNILTDRPYNANKIHEMFQQKQGKFVFTVPKHHLGYQNYFMMALKDRVQRNRGGAEDGYLFGDVQVSVVCEGDGLFQGAIGQAVEQMMVKKGIKFYKNMKYQIDGKNNKIIMSPLTTTPNKPSNQKSIPPNPKTSSTSQSVSIPFTYVFSYTPFSSKLAWPVDPTMLHSIPYPNIYILGPTPQNRIHSFSTILKMTNCVARSLVYDIIGVRRRTIYDGEWKLRLWTSYKQLVQIQGNQRDNKWKMTGQTFGAFRSYFKSNLYPAFVNSMINESPFNLGSYQKVAFQPPRKYSQSYKNKNQQNNKTKKAENVKKP